MINKENLILSRKYNKYLEDRNKKEESLLQDIYIINSMMFMDENLHTILGSNLGEEEKVDMLKREFTIFNTQFGIM